jgi:spore germination cell wall hydrolase CwlJ-like protein
LTYHCGVLLLIGKFKQEFLKQQRTGIMKCKMTTAYAATTLALIIATSTTIHTLNQIALIEQASDTLKPHSLALKVVARPELPIIDISNLQLDIPRPKILTMHLPQQAVSDLQVALVSTSILSKVKAEGINREAEIICLARNIYQESRGEDDTDKYAVGFVTRNRVQRSRGENYCEIVYQVLKTPRALVRAAAEIGEDPPKMAPQFSWVGQGFEIHEKAAWVRSQEIAYDIYMHPSMPDTTHGATHYYDQMLVKPAWAKHARILLKTKHHTYVALRSEPIRKKDAYAVAKVILQPGQSKAAGQIAVLY